MSYAKKVLRESSVTMGWLTTAIHRVKGFGQRIYLVRSLEDFKALPRKAATAYQCPCGSLFAWMGDPRDQPECPECKERKEGGKLYVLRNQKEITDLEDQYKAKNAYGYEDGVYVDVSYRNKTLVLGFAVVRNEVAEFYSCASKHKGSHTAYAETEACLIAQKKWPDLPTYCDHDASCTATGARYINREKNKLAHRVARSRINYKAGGL